MNTFKSIGTLLLLLILLLCAIEAKATDPERAPSLSGTLPVMYITTEDHKPIVSKEEYLNATYWLDPMGTDGVEPLGSESEPQPMQIRGRGHSSWKGVKKPYKIKLGEKTAIMGLPANKHWALLKPTENTVAGLRLGKLMEMVWTPDFRPIEVVLNGNYIGLYFLTETIRIDKNRVNIHEQQNREKNPDMIKGGWLVEIDNYPDKCQITVPENGFRNLTIRYHSPKELSTEQKQWLTDEFNAINDAVYSTDKTSTEWEQYLDVESMAQFFIIQEIMDNPDGFHGSFYLHKDLNDTAVWKAGPIWDLVCYNRDKTDFTFRMKAHYGFTPHWIGEIIGFDSFCRAVKKVWNDVYPDKITEVFDYIDDIVLPLSEAWQNDCARWNDDPSQTAETRAYRIKRALLRNMEWFDEHLPSAGAATKPTSRPNAENKPPVEVFNLQGICIGRYPDESEAVSDLQPGIYIINGQKLRIR